MIDYIKQVRKQGDTVGGVVDCVIKGCPSGLGEPVFDRLHAELGKAMLSINACKGFQYGSGFDGVDMLGSQHNDPMVAKGGGGQNDKQLFRGYSRRYFERDGYLFQNRLQAGGYYNASTAIGQLSRRSCCCRRKGTTRPLCGT